MILLYHKIHPDPKTAFWVTPDAFYMQMLDLKAFEVVPLERYDPANPKHRVLTFDGVYDNVLQFAAPILRHFKYPFELFVVGNYVGRDNAFDAPEPLARFADMAALEKLVSAGGRLQWHTASHRLPGPEEPVERIDEELRVPDSLRRLCPDGFTWFAYPHGRVHQSAEDRVRRAFQGAVLADSEGRTDRYRLTRHTILEQTRFNGTTVSVIIPCYNYGHFAAEAIESVLRQTVVPEEILFIDDASSDSSADVASRYADRVRVVVNEKNLGIVANFSKAVNLTSGDYICFLGADNRFKSDYIEKAKMILDTEPEVGIVYTNVVLWGDRAEVVANDMGAERHPFAPSLFLKRYPANPAVPIEQENYIHGSSMYRRAAYRQAGGYMPSDRAEDHSLFARIVAKGWTTRLLDDYMLDYRQHSASQANILKGLELENAQLRQQLRREEDRKALDAENQRLQALLHDSERRLVQIACDVKYLQAHIASLEASRGWRLLNRAWKIRTALMPRGGARERCVRRIYRLLRYVLGSLSRRIRETVLPDEPPAIGSSTAFRPDGVKREPLAGYPFDTVIGEPFSPERIEAVLCHESESLVPARYDVICLSIIDWDFRFQRPQQIMSQFARHGHRVFYVTSSRWFRERDQDPFRVRSVGERLYEVELQSASFWSVYQQVPSAADIDRMLDSLDSLRKTFQIHGAVLYVHAASWTRVAMRARALWDWPVIYECLDDWGHFPHIGSQFKLKEPELVAGSDGVIVTAQRLHDKWAVKSKRTLLARNAADAQFYDAACKPNDILAKAGRPVIGYIGAIADWFDVGLVTRIARRHPDWDFVLVGGIFDTKVDKLRALSNVTFLGQQPYESMPKYLHHFDACIIPFLINDVTRATDPVKFYEYIAAGKPVVSVNLPELALYRDVVYLAETEDQFDSLLAKALTETDPGLAERRKRLARENSWPRRYDAIRAFIDEAMPLVSIVIVSYNNKHLTKLCLESVLAGTKYPRFEVVVVDNASTDGARNMLRGMAERNETIRLIENDANVGFAKANNIGIREARGRFLVLLNNDTVVSNGWLARLVWHLQDPQIGLVGPRTNFVGNEARVDVKYKTWAEMEEAAALLGIASDREVADMRMLAMFCVAMRRDAYERIGPLDEQFEVGMFEDDDYSMRMHRSGYRVVCAMDTFVHHVGQAAFGPLIRSGKYDEIFNLNKKKYEEKWKVAWTPHQLGTLRGSWHADNREEMRKRGRRTAPLPAQSAAPETPAPAVPLEAKTVEYEAGLQKEGLAWGKHMQREAEKELAAWLDHPLVLDHYRRRSLVDGVPWETWIRRHFGGPVSASMELGCGTGTRSLALWSDGISCHIEGLDISAERVAEAEKSRLAVGAPGRFEVGDVNKAELRPSAYDLVFSCHSFHHFLYLESIMECVDKSLKKGGLFVLEEYVGPTQFQWSDKQIRVAQDALSMLPNKLKHCRNGRVKTREGRPTPEQVVAVSPFEAIRSADILPLFERYFDILEIKKLGGTVQHLVYNGIMHNFDPSDVESSKYIANIGDLEDRLIDTGTLTSDFVLVIGRNKQ